MKWLIKRFKSKTIWLTTIAPSVLAFMTLYSQQLKQLMDEYYLPAFVFFAAIAWISREITNSSLRDK